MIDNENKRSSRKIRWLFANILFAIFCSAFAAIFFEAMFVLFAASLTVPVPLDKGQISFGSSFVKPDFLPEIPELEKIYTVEKRPAGSSGASDAGTFFMAMTLENSEGKARVTYSFSTSRKIYIYVLMLIWLYFRMLPAIRFLSGRTGVTAEAAAKSLNGVYKNIIMFFVVPAVLEAGMTIFIGAYNYDMGTFRNKALNLFSPLVWTYFAGYFTLLQIEPYIFMKAWPEIYPDAPAGMEKTALFSGLKRRIFLNIINLFLVPLALVLFISQYPKLSSNVSRGFSTGITFISLIYAIIYTRMLYFGIQMPVSELIKKMERVAKGDFSCRTSVLSNDEIGSLKRNFNLMVEGLAEREMIRETFGRHVSEEIAKHLIDSNKIDLGGEVIEATVLFADIRNFTAMSEKMSAKEVIDFLNDYFSYITVPIKDNRGVINKFIGDAVMAVYTPYLGSDEHAADAVKSAAGMRNSLAGFNRAGKYPFKAEFGVGIHSGALVAGNVGTSDRLEYTFIGDTVNVASRIESENKNLSSDILISEETFLKLDENLRSRLKFEKCEKIKVKGRAAELTLYKIM